MDLAAVVVTGAEVYLLQVRGPLMNQTWNNIGFRWIPYIDDNTIPYTERGGLELYVNAIKVGHAIKPLDPPKSVGSWIERSVLIPTYTDRTWRNVGTQAPVCMVGCHRNSDDKLYR